MVKEVSQSLMNCLKRKSAASLYRARGSDSRADPSTWKIWVNVSGGHFIMVPGGQQLKVTGLWAIEDATANFPMAYDICITGYCGNVSLPGSVFPPNHALVIVQ